MTVKVAREAVDQIVNGSTVIFQMFDDLPVNQARMRTDFGYVLKTFGEAAFADPKSLDVDFSNELASSRLVPRAHEEIWAHEGWKLCQVMNRPDIHVLPLLVSNIDVVISVLGFECTNVESIFWQIVNGNHCPIVTFSNDDDPLNTGNDVARGIVLQLVNNTINHYTKMYGPIVGHWYSEVLMNVGKNWRGPLADRAINAQHPDIIKMIEVMQTELNTAFASDPLTSGWAVAPFACLVAIADFVTYGFEPTSGGFNLQTVPDQMYFAANTDLETPVDKHIADSMIAAVAAGTLFEDDPLRGNPRKYFNHVRRRAQELAQAVLVEVVGNAQRTEHVSVHFLRDFAQRVIG